MADAPMSALAMRRARLAAATAGEEGTDVNEGTEPSNRAKKMRARPAAEEKEHLARSFSPLPTPPQHSPFPPSSPHRSVYTPTTSNSQWDPATRSMQCALQATEILLLRGLALLRVVRGSIYCAGARLTPSSACMRIYAPEVYPAAAIYAAPASEKGGAFPEHDAVLCITASSPGIERIASVCPLAGPDPFLQSTAAPRTFTILADADAFIVPQEWRACIDEIQCASTPKVLVRGPKNAGKSSLAKLLLNALLSTHRFVAFLDLDMGQPEFGPPGFVALHVFDAHQEPGVFGPAWCLARVPLRAHFLGDISPREEPAQYSASVAALLRYFSTELHIYKDESQVLRCLHVEPSSTKTQRTPTTMPLIVNTHGWSKGLGADLVDAAARALGPSHVFALAEQAGLCAWHDTVYAREIQDTRRRTVNAAEVRQLDLLAYLHATQLPRPAMCIAPCWDFTPLLERRPYVVDLRTGLAGGISILPLGAPVVERFALLALNGSLAALVARTPARSTHSDPWRAALSQGTTLPSHAFGLVLLRSIDEQRGALHMLTPLSPDMLAAYLDAECTSLGLVKGALELPIWASLDQQAYADAVQQRPTEPGQLLAGVPRYQVPYLAWPTELLAQGAIGARPRKVRRNVMRRAHAK